MKIYTLPDGREVKHGEPFTMPNGSKMPANWLELAKPEELKALKISVRDVVPTPPVEPPPPPAPEPTVWAVPPIVIVRVLKAWGVAEALLKTMQEQDPVGLVEFQTAFLIAETEPRLGQMLIGVGKTIDDLKKAVADGAGFLVEPGSL